MRVYRDSSALLSALAAQAVLSRLDEGEHVTRPLFRFAAYSPLNLELECPD
jgi:hypothetical protein